MMGNADANGDDDNDGDGDCRFLCALAALAERPNHVYRMLIDDDVTPTDPTAPVVQVHANPEGVYKVRYVTMPAWW